MFFNVEKRDAYLNQIKQENKKLKPNSNVVQRKRTIKSIFNLNSIIKSKYVSSCGSCG